MAGLTTLTDGTTTITLINPTAPGIDLIRRRPASVNRAITRVASMWAEGSRTLHSSLNDSSEDFTAVIRGTSVDNVDSQYAALVRLLEQARRWEEERTGAPVRLLTQRNGTTAIAYQVVTGVPQMPDVINDVDWFRVEPDNNITFIRFTLTLEPLPHAGALTMLVAATARTNTPGANYVTATPALGNMPAPVNVRLDLGVIGPPTWPEFWLATLAGTPHVVDFSGTVEAGAYGGQVLTGTANGTKTMTTGALVTLTDKFRRPTRAMLRIKATSGTVNKLRFRLWALSGVGGNVSYGPWITYGGKSGAYALHNLHTVSLAHLFNIPDLNPATQQVTVGFEYYTIDGTSVNWSADYMELLSEIGFVEGGAILNNNADYAEYVSTGVAGAFYYPTATPQMYEGLIATSVIQRFAGRYGTLPPITPGEAIWIWANGNGNSAGRVHSTVDNFTLSAKYLPRYAAPLRGAG